MLPAPLTPRRKLALGIALPWVTFMLVYWLCTFHFRADPVPFANWHLAALAAWAVASAAASGIVITELSRLTVRSSVAWSDRRHFRVALIVSLTLLGIQSLSLALAFYPTGARAF